jgi:ketosteroid isomerase-like protein
MTGRPLDVIREWNRAFARNEVERYFSFIDPEISVITPTNPYRVEGLEQDREEFEFSLARGSTWVNLFQMMHPREVLLGDTALVTYFWRGSLGKGDAAVTGYFKETNLLVRRAEGWRIIHIHLSRAT